MIVDKDENITLITQKEASIKTLANSIEQAYNIHKDQHLIINLLDLDEITIKDITAFLQLSNTHRSNKKSFVIVSSKVDLDHMPDQIIVVPTLQEAQDVIEMEAMERDLGF